MLNESWQNKVIAMDKNQLVPQNDDEILDAFADLMAERIPDDLEEIEALLKEAELDPMQIETEATTLIAEARARTPLDWRNRRQEMEAVGAKHGLAGADLPSDRQGLLDLLRRLISQSPARRAYAHYRERRPEDLSNEELRSLVQDIRFISGEDLDEFSGKGSQ